MCVCLYLCSQSSFPDLGDIGVCVVECVQVHIAELIIELHPELPRQVIVSVVHITGY